MLNEIATMNNILHKAVEDLYFVIEVKKTIIQINLLTKAKLLIEYFSSNY